MIPSMNMCIVFDIHVNSFIVVLFRSLYIVSYRLRFSLPRASTDLLLPSFYDTLFLSFLLSFCNSILYKSAFSPRRVGRASCRLTLQEGAPIDDIKDEEREGEEESGNLVDVNGGGSSLAAFVILNRRWPHWTSASIEIRPHWRLRKSKN
jgi:hypothetical protein